MPVADFPGRFGWGYDGVNFFAPTRLYGKPDDFRRFVDQAHAVGLGVILDVVYNHFGPDGNYLKELSEHYFTDRYANEWGDAINFDGEHAGPVRDFVLSNAELWIAEYHLDGLRLDATQQIFDASPEHILAALARRVRSVAPQRATLLVAENEPQDVRIVQPPEVGGYGLDAVWNDDFHHTATVALTGLNAAYYSDYVGRPQEFVSAMKWGYLYQGPTLSLAEEAERHADVRSIAGKVRHVHPESRPDRQLCTRLPEPSPDEPRPPQGDYGFDAARTRDADAIPGSGVRGVVAFPVFCRPQARARPAGPSRSS
jgi:maltooligosyltrehalose trehalohydrolase